jgi:hypothetical protein
MSLEKPRCTVDNPVPPRPFQSYILDPDPKFFQLEKWHSAKTRHKDTKE